MSTVKVELTGAVFRSYPIVIERGILDRVGAGMKGLGLSGRCAVVTNPTVGAIYSKRLMDSLKDAGFLAALIEIPDGEEHKTLSTVASVYDRLLEERLDRDSSIIALGGGVVGDMAGFVASTFLRGVPYVQVPTTLLAQVDSSVGGKTGVNHPQGKNLIGAFYQPRGVFIDPDALETLDKRELRAGLSEVVKYGVIRDEAFFSFIEANVNGLLNLKSAIVEAIVRSCRIKAEVVMKDERESGLRGILNFGHTFGHAIEARTGYTAFRHGEAVSIGMVMAAGLSLYLAVTTEGVQKRIKNLLVAFGLPVDAPGIAPSDFIETVRLDKKVKAGNIRFVLVEDMGRVAVKDVEGKKLKDFLELYCHGRG
ncbi:MAG: 3-dehydroquinate synthase [Deltaproteobacteria bacterium]|nr:3-dehydroquinate synthase [Deltaproteobacteria bacterium]